MSTPPFQRLDKVVKVTGYRFPGTVVGVFQKLDGEWRVNVESSLAPGWVHIFAPHLLALMEERDE